MKSVFNESLEANRRSLINELGFSFDKPKALADCVVKLSDFYIEFPSAATPWNEKWAQAAYLSYYLPLNFVRAKNAVMRAAQMGFFVGLKSAVDFGSGLGSGQLSVASADSSIDQILCYDHNLIPMELHRKLLGDSAKTVRWTNDFKPSELPEAKSRLAILSYVYTELKELPAWARESEALLILEPSTRDDGRRLQALRGELIDSGMTAFAPCTHQAACPLLAESGKDWCHHRVDFEGDPDWMRLEEQLPMKNRTLTYSYLAIRRTSAPTAVKGNLARVIGDELPEKGKTRQLFCRGPHREFLAWFPGRMKEQPVLKRGDLIRFKPGAEKTLLEPKANELRVKDASALETVTLPETKL